MKLCKRHHHFTYGLHDHTIISGSQKRISCKLKDGIRVGKNPIKDPSFPGKLHWNPNARTREHMLFDWKWKQSRKQNKDWNISRAFHFLARLLPSHRTSFYNYKINPFEIDVLLQLWFWKMVIPTDGSSQLSFTNESISSDIFLQRRVTSGDDLSRLDLIAIWWPRASGLATVITGVIMLYMAWPRRKFVFHRLVLGKEQ